MTNFSRIFVTTCRDLTDFEGMVGLRLVLEEAAKSTMEKSLSETRSSLDSKSSRFFTVIAIFSNSQSKNSTPAIHFNHQVALLLLK